jgi:alanine racemase
MIARLDIDLAALQRNAARLRELTAPSQLWPVVKANAYGHGLTEASLALESVADGLCVYHIEAALAIREAGVRLPILLLGPLEPTHLEAAHAADISITLWDTGAYRREVTAIARKHGTAFGVHAKVDTGVTRYGLEAIHAANALADFLDDRDLRVSGVYTHLAAVEELASSFTQEQLARFAWALEPLAPALRERGVRRHAAASAAAMLFPQSRMDLIRPGIATYGLWPSPQTQAMVKGAIDLEPVLAWRSELVLVREVPAWQSVGYGCTYHTTRPSRIGLVPIGYAEGIPRAVSNTGAMLVAGERAPIIGRVCMNTTFIDVTDIPEARAGSRVTLIGRHGDASISADDWATWAGTINYEIVTRLPREVPRRYLSTEAASLQRPREEGNSV